MRRSTLAVLLFFVVLDSFVFYGVYIKHRAEMQPVSLSAPVPQFVWTDLEGTSHNVRDLTGHAVLLHFWASWCAPCREEFPKLLKLAAAHKELRILALSSDADKEKARQFVKMIPDMSGIKAPPNMLYGWDPAKVITYDQFLTERYPETIVIDPTQRMRRKYPGSADWQSMAEERYLNEIETGK